MLPSFVVGHAEGKVHALYVGMDAGEAKRTYSANVTNTKFSKVQLFIRPEADRRASPEKTVARDQMKVEEAAKRAAEEKAAETEKPIEQPKRKATK